MLLLEYKPLRPGKDYGRGYLKAYAEEARRWPREQNERVGKHEVLELYAHLRQIFSLNEVEVKFALGRGGGRYTYGRKGKGRTRRPVIRLTHGAEYDGFRWGLAIHEYAHHLAQYGRKKDIGHGRDFWDALERAYLAANTWKAAQEAPYPAEPGKATRGPARPYLERLNERLARRGYRLVNCGGDWWEFEPLPGFPEIEEGNRGVVAERVNSLSFEAWEGELTDKLP